tara:strand:+ start:1756 stop:2199 length:444 start_codon:yes stop_codon:yes gene_type:complete
MKKKSENLKNRSLSPFEFLNSITQQKNDLFEGTVANELELHPDSPSRAYVPFMVNRGLSYHQDTVLAANEMNRVPDLAPKIQYDFLRNIIRPRKRFSKWTKKIDDGKAVKAIMRRYSYSADKARSALTLLSPDEVKSIMASVSEGGR